MAGLAALMTRKKRDRRLKLEQLKDKLQDPVAMSELTGKEAEEMAKARAAHETIKKLLNGKELLHQKTKSFDALSQVSLYGGGGGDGGGGEEGEGGGAAGGDAGYSTLYVGLLLVSIGVVISFVGLGEKGFKTVQLKLIGPTLSLIGIAIVLFKVLQCIFPQFTPAFFRARKLERMKRDQEEDGGGGGGGGEENKGKGGVAASSSSPCRVTLHSAKRPRPASSIPNYIEASSGDEDDDFNSKPNTGREEIILNPGALQL